ncbi:unnamed protein product [Microthlaspi erraticum]|uniref:BSD domain-containing protein n=1 Tax=Microthlaspi erraticum TaxID=1685480 RepID=A0A6D2KFG8_9BRAS|nr:unnamed protein product [Microthlaspi erraticum]
MFHHFIIVHASDQANHASTSESCASVALPSTSFLESRIRDASGRFRALPLPIPLPERETSHLQRFHASGRLRNIYMESVKAKFKGSMNDRGTPGILKIMKGKLIFEPDDLNSDSKHEVQSQDIESRQYTKEGSLPLFRLINIQKRRHIYEFENHKSLNAFRDLITKAFTICEEEPKKKSAVLTSAEQLSVADSELRVKLLSENRVLTEDEFWATRKELLGKDSIRKKKQQVGLKSLMVSGIKPSTDGQSNRVTFNITPEIILQIFSEKPAVRQAFINYVPSKMTEKDFWTKYFRAEYLHSTKNAAVASAEAAEDELLAVLLKPDEIAAQEIRRKVRRFDDMVANQADDYSHIMWDGIRDVVEPKNYQFRRSLAQDINRHSATVLEGRIIDVETEDSRTVAEALTLAKQEKKDVNQERLKDLQERQNFSLKPLSIKEPRDYFESQQVNVLNEHRGAKESNISLHEAYRLLQESISEVRSRGLNDPLTKPQVSLEVISELNRMVSTNKNNTTGNSPSDSVLDKLPKSMKDEYLHQWTSIQELLRHYWSCYPITTTYLSTKVGKLKEAMSKTYSQLETMKELVQSDLRHEFSLLVRPVQKALDAVFEHYEADLQRRITKSHEGKIL